jgi:hypothetical protein
MAVIGNAISFLDLHKDGPNSANSVKRQFSIVRSVNEPLNISCFQIEKIRKFGQGLMKEFIQNRAPSDYRLVRPFLSLCAWHHQGVGGVEDDGQPVGLCEGVDSD